MFALEDNVTYIFEYLSYNNGITWIYSLKGSYQTNNTEDNERTTFHFSDGTSTSVDIEGELSVDTIPTTRDEAFNYDELIGVEIGTSVSSIGTSRTQSFGMHSYAFDNCAKLAYVKIPNSVTRICHHAFSNCPKLASINIPSSVTEIDPSAFNGSGLMSLNIPDSVNKINNDAFANCTNLKTIRLPDQLKILNAYVFRNCTNLTTVELPEELTHIGQYSF